MTRSEFLKKIEYGIRGLKESDKVSVVKYYDELISDKVDAMGSEDKAIDSFGSIDRIILDILTEYNVAPQEKEKVKTANILIIILMFPIWISLIIGVFGLLVGLWAGVFAIGATSLGLFLAGVCVAIFALYDGIANSLLIFGTCLVSIGLSIVFALLVGVLSKYLGKFTKLCAVGIKNLFVRSVSL